jgi:ribosomal RNA assembly protein
LIMAVLFVRIPEERIAVLIGTGGSARRDLEARTGTTLEIDPDDGGVRISSPDSGDPIGALKARDVALAIGRGFSPARASRLLGDDVYLGVIDIKRVSNKRDKAALRRIRSRLIGVDGRARTRIEELSGASMSVYGGTVALIGKEGELTSATRAVELLLRGSEHSTVFHMLARMRDDEALRSATEPIEIPDGE